MTRCSETDSIFVWLNRPTLWNRKSSEISSTMSPRMATRPTLSFTTRDWMNRMWSTVFWVLICKSLLGKSSWRVSLNRWKSMSLAPTNWIRFVLGILSLSRIEMLSGGSDFELNASEQSSWFMIKICHVYVYKGKNAKNNSKTSWDKQE